MSQNPKFLDCHPLVVDDDPDFTLLLRRCLIQADVPKLNIRTSPDGHSAVELLAQGEWTPSLVLLDHKMPRRTGLEVLEWMRSRGSLKAVPVFMMSTGAEPEFVSAALQMGAEAYFVKPLSIEELQNHVHNILAYWKSGTRGGPIPGSAQANEPS